MTGPSRQGRNGASVNIEQFLIARTSETESRVSAIHLDGCATHATKPRPCDCAMPLRALRMCAAVREVIAFHQPGQPVEARDEEGSRHPSFVPCMGHETSWVEYPCRALRIAAAVYADHHDYRTGWAPQ